MYAARLSFVWFSRGSKTSLLRALSIEPLRGVAGATLAAIRPPRSLLVPSPAAAIQPHLFQATAIATVACANPSPARLQSLRRRIEQPQAAAFLRYHHANPRIRPVQSQKAHGCADLRRCQLRRHSAFEASAGCGHSRAMDPVYDAAVVGG